MFEIITTIAIVFCVVAIIMIFKQIRQLCDDDEGAWFNYMIYKICVLGMFVCYQVYSFTLPEPRLIRWKFITILIAISALFFIHAFKKTRKKIKELKKELEKYKAFFIND